MSEEDICDHCGQRKKNCPATRWIQATITLYIVMAVVCGAAILGTVLSA